MKQQDTGLLLNKNNINLHRGWFKEFTRLMGINVIYKSPKSDKHYNTHGEIESNYNDPIVVGCIFEEHPTPKTMKKLGWNTELEETSSIIHVPYDLENLQRGALFIIPSPIDSSQGRVFRVDKISSIMVYPCSLACELVPEWEDTMEESNTQDFSQSNFNFVKEEDLYGRD